ncbi:MAG: hypothetical protein AAB415_02720 [Patescibacteria group bacterium]
MEQERPLARRCLDMGDLKYQIERTDKKIDEEIYKLYGLTADEIKIVENS